MMVISWSQFDRNQSSKDVSFESFCFQIAYKKYKEFGYFDNFFNTPGSEFYLTLHSDCKELGLSEGDVVGWQVKWWFDNEESTKLLSHRRKELVKGFRTTLKRHSDIRLWIICTPGKFVEDTFNKLKDTLQGESKRTRFIHWNKALFENALAIDFDGLGALYHHYFSSDFVGMNKLRAYSERRIQDLNKKFDTDLYTPSHYDEEIFFLVNYKSIFEELRTRIKYLQDEVDEIVQDSHYAMDSFKSYEKEYLEKAYELLYTSIDAAKTAFDVISSGISIQKGRLLLTFLRDFTGKRQVLVDWLRHKIKSNEHLIDGAKEYGAESWHHGNYLIGACNKLFSMLVSSESKEDEPKAILELLNDLFQKEVHILSSAGYGKTNIACNISQSCLDRGIPCLLILGSSFRKSERPQKMILEQLELENKYNFKQFLEALNALGVSKGVKVPIVIDGLNESKPYDDIWKTNLLDIIRDVNEFEFIVLITTCRDRYIEVIFDEPDISKIRNTKVLNGLSEKQRLQAIPKYFKKYGIEPTSWSFNKDLFVNPLLLKIFSEANQNAKNIHISLENVFSSIESYIAQVEDISGEKDPVLKNSVRQRIQKYCTCLWECNDREISLIDFHGIMAPGRDLMTGSVTERLLSEGLCFQTNHDGTNENVQFTYDLVGGYAIASRVLLNSINGPDQVHDCLVALGVNEKLFSESNAHQLRQDILMSLIYLLSKKYGVQLFEVFDNEIVIGECFNNIDYFIADSEGRNKLIKRIESEDKSGRNYRLLFEKLFENSFKKGVDGLGETTVHVLSKLNQAEIDIYWSELVRKNRSHVHQTLSRIHQNLDKGVFTEFDKCFFESILCTTSSDKSIRTKATENLFGLAKESPMDFLNRLRQLIIVKDLNMLESAIVALCGSVMVLKDRDYTTNCLDFLEGEFLSSFESTHASIIDYILTIAEFGKHFFETDHIHRIQFDSSYFSIQLDETVLNEFKHEWSFEFTHVFGLDLYDFVKHQIRGIATDAYDRRSTFSVPECMALISMNVKRKGYDEQVFDPLKTEFNEDTFYRYGRGTNDNLVFYPEKYLWQSYYELVGYLSLQNKLVSEDGLRFRCDYNFFDPTFPKKPQKFQIVTGCFFPSEGDDVQNWVNSDQCDFVDPFLIHSLHTNDEWVLLGMNLIQNGEENKTRIHISLEGFLVPKEKINQFEIEIERGFHDNSGSFYHLYAGEINWSRSSTLVDGEFHKDGMDLVKLVHSYSWTGWSNNRMTTPNFEFLNSEVSRKLDLQFNPSELAFYKNQEQVTRIVWSDGAELYYCKKSLVQEMMGQYDLGLVWYQFISKYGDFGNLSHSKLNPSYKDIRRILTWSEMVGLSN